MKLSALSGMFQVRTSPVSVHWSVTSKMHCCLQQQLAQFRLPLPVSTSRHGYDDNDVKRIVNLRSAEKEARMVKTIKRNIFLSESSRSRTTPRVRTRFGAPGGVTGRDSEWQRVGQNVSIDCCCRFAGVIDLHREL